MTIRKTAAALVLAAGFASRANAQTSVPNAFTAGAPARAADVNANFQFVMDQIQVLKAQIVAAQPTGTVLSFAGPLLTDADTPAGFLVCNGLSYATTDYPALFAVIGYTYGGSGGTFNVPDLRGEFIRGSDSGRNVDPGRALGSEQLDAFQGHRHNPLSPDSAILDQTSGGSFAGASGSTATARGTTGDPAADGTNGTPRTAKETRPRNLALNFIIKT
jgi:microcystin-dependent protein